MPLSVDYSGSSYFLFLICIQKLLVPCHHSQYSLVNGLGTVSDWSVCDGIPDIVIGPIMVHDGQLLWMLWTWLVT